MHFSTDVPIFCVKHAACIENVKVGLIEKKMCLICIFLYGSLKIIRAQLLKADNKSLGPACWPYQLSRNTYIFSKERFLLLWILPFLLSFHFHSFKEQSRLRSGRKLAISIQTNPKTESVSKGRAAQGELFYLLGNDVKFLRQGK